MDCMTKRQRNNLLNDLKKLNFSVLKPVDYTKQGFKFRIKGKMKYGVIDSIELLDMFKIIHRKPYIVAFSINNNEIEFW